VRLCLSRMVRRKDVACGTRNGGLYHQDMAHQRHVAAVASLQLRHERLGNVIVAGLKRMINHIKVDGLK